MVPMAHQVVPIHDAQMATLDRERSTISRADWRLSVLGPVEIHLGGRRVAVAGVARSVLALLTRSAGQVISVEAMVDGLWGSRPPAGAERAVASYVSRLRKALGNAGGPDAAAVVVTRAPGYLLAVDSSTVDVAAFEQRVAEGRRALGIGQPALAARRLREALDLWRGEAYADVPDAAFAPAETRRLSELRLAAVESRVDADLAAAAPTAPAALVGDLQSLVAEHPHRERFWTQLITCLYRLGQQAEALAAYQLARTRLVEDLGVEPGAELRAAELAVLAGDVNLTGRPILATAVPDGLPGPVPGCVGRDEELAWLEAALDEAATTHGQARLVVGGAGFGKTRLVAELAHRASLRGTAIRYGAGAALNALVAEPDRLQLVILDDVDEASSADIARVSAWVRASRGRPVLTVLTATDASALGELARVPTLPLVPLTDRAVADVIGHYTRNGSREHGTPEVVGGLAAAIAAGGIPSQIHAAASAWFTAEASRRLEGAVAAVAEPQQQLDNLRDDILASVLDLGHARATTHAVQTSGRDLVACPYKGLAAFETSDAELFHGRERLVAELVARLVQAHLLAVVGASGSGKSSVVRAGLLPALAAGVLPGSAQWRQLVLTPAGTRDLGAAIGSYTSPTLLFVDQFEEVYTALDGPRREAFITALVTAVESGRVTVVIALRSDFYGRCADHAVLSALVAANTVLVRPMAADELRRAVERPAAMAGLLLEPGLTDILVDDVRDATGALPLLSTSLLALWERRSGRTLTLAAYREAGGVAGAVEQMGERAYASLATDDLKASARRMLLRLADTGGEHAVVRRRATREEVESVGGAVAPSVLDILAERRLVTVANDMVEVAHEALLTHWPRLRQWLADDAAGRELRAHLTPAAVSWARSGDTGELYRGARLAAALEWLSEHAAELTRAEKDFVRASQDAAAWEALQSRRTVRRLRQTLAAAAVALVVAVVGCVVAVSEQRRADAAAAAADARRLAAQALVERDLGTALLFGVAATRLYDTPETRANLLATLNRAPALLRTDTLTDGDQYQGLALSPDGLTLALSTARGRIQLYDAESLRFKRTLTYPARYVAKDLDFTRDGRRLVTFADLVPVGEHGMVEWDVATGDPIGEPYGPMATSEGDVLADGDSVVVLDSAASTAEVWSLGSRQRVRVLPGAGSVVSMTITTDQSSIVLGHKDATTIVDASTWSSETYPKIAGGGALSPDGRTLLVRDGPDVVLWDLESQSQRGVARQHSAGVIDLVWGRDGKTFVSTSDDRSVIAWDVASIRPVEVFSGAPGRQLHAGYSWDGKTLFSAGQDGGVYLWDLTRTRRWQIQLDPAGPYNGDNLDPANAAAVYDIPRSRAVVTEGQNAYLVDVAVGKPTGPPIDLGSPLHQWPELSSDGERLAIGLATGRGRVWDTGTRRLLLDVLVADPAGDQIWNYVNAGISGDGRTAAFAAFHYPPTNRTEITFYDVDTGIQLAETWRLEGAAANRIGASPDGTYLVATTTAGYAAVWNLRERREVARLELPEKGSATLARFSRDGQYLAVGTGVGRPALWRVDGWQLMWQAEVGHNGYDIALSFSPDGSVMASSGTDSKIFMYDVATGGLLGGAFGPDRNSWLYAEYRADRNELVGYFDDGSMSRWDVDAKSQVRTACKIAGRDMTQREWDRLLPGRPFQSVCPG
jgi:DNA-binding SARP family transcriptional activator